MSDSRRLILSTAACLFLAACAGFRGGWESLPYVGDPPPQPAESRTPYEAQRRSELSLPGLTLGVSINNQLRTYDTQVYLYALPLSIDPRDVYSRTIEPGKTRVSLRVIVHDTSFVFRPKLAVLRVADQQASGAAGFQFGRWDEAGNRVGSGGKWGYQPVDDEFALTEIDRAYFLSIDFPLSVPPPESPKISLDLSTALQSPSRPPVPLIHFLPVRWKEGYT